MTKPFFARYVLELAADGELDLAAPITPDVDLDEFGAAPDPRLEQITPAMVLAHHAGFPNWAPEGEPLRLLANPGETYIYSGEGFQLLLKALENRRGPEVVLAELEQLLDRCGMKRSSFIDTPDRDRDRATPHDTDGKPLPFRPRKKVGAYGNLDTCLDDYVRFLRNTFWGDAAPGVLELLTDSYSVLPGGGRTLGWGWWPGGGGRRILWQNGDNPGFKHLVLVAPSAGQAVVVFTNGENGLTITDETADWFRAAAGRSTRSASALWNRS